MSRKFSSVLTGILFFSLISWQCTKIDTTDIGGNLIPAVDNVNTFEVFLNAVTDNKLANDTISASFTDQVAIGHITDPEFGTSHANAYFDIGRSGYGSYPFIAGKDSIKIDSVILSLSYQGKFGDTTSLNIMRL